MKEKKELDENTPWNEIHKMAKEAQDIEEELDKGRIYLKPGEKPPKGVSVRRGTKGGMYYETKAPEAKTPQLGTRRREEHEVMKVTARNRTGAMLEGLKGLKYGEDRIIEWNGVQYKVYKTPAGNDMLRMK